MSGDDWTVEDVAGLLRDHEGKLRKCCLLIGAGVSLTAGIGTGPGFVKLIRERHSKSYSRAERKARGNSPTYNACMSELTEFERSALVREQIEAAHINWAHIGIGRLEAAKCVDRILTTNFDPLASRACALFNNFPAVYDLAALRDAPGGAEHARFIPAFVSGSAIYHLHGQHTGFLLLNTEELLERQAQRIEPALQEATSGRTVIVCGYSGENDPLVERLARQGAFPHGLIWVRHDEEDPCGAVMERLLSRFDDCHIVRNKPADLFFTELADALDLDQPAFLTRPFEHLDTVLDRIRPFSDVSLGSVDLLDQARTLLREAQQQSRRESPDQNTIAELMAQRRYQEVVDRFGKDLESRSESERDLIAWALIMVGLAAYEAALLDAGSADALFAEAVEKFAAALAINPDKHEALHNWGTAIAAQAKMKQGEAADALFAEAGEKFATALAINPDKHEALNNWGNALADQAHMKQGEAADALFGEAGEKFAAAIAIKPDKHEALYNWGAALADQAGMKQGETADALFAEAGEKFAAAVAIKPDMHDALNNWGAALAARAKMKHGKAADTLFAAALAKFAAAVAIKPDKHEALNNWGTALAAQAGMKQGESADALFAEAGAKFASALAIKPDLHGALNNWGTALAEQAKMKQGEAADTLFKEAIEKYAAALAIKPDMPEALNNWGNALADQAKMKQGDAADALFAEAGAKFTAALAINSDMHEALNNWGNALAAQAGMNQGEAADALFAEAGEKFAAALKIKPNRHEALNNWAVALMSQAKTKTGAPAEALARQSVEKCELAESILPGSASYNLACVHALAGDAEKASFFLRRSKEEGLDFPGCDHIAGDSDFDAVRQLKAFTAALAAVGC